MSARVCVFVRSCVKRGRCYEEICNKSMRLNKTTGNCELGAMHHTKASGNRWERIYEKKHYSLCVCNPSDRHGLDFRPSSSTNCEAWRKNPVQSSFVVLGGLDRDLPRRLPVFRPCCSGNTSRRSKRRMSFADVSRLRRSSPVERVLRNDPVALLAPMRSASSPVQRLRWTDDITFPVAPPAN